MALSAWNKTVAPGLSSRSIRHWTHL